LIYPSILTLLPPRQPLIIPAAMSEDTSANSNSGSIFPRTNWAELGRAAQAEPVPLDRLIRAYWQPLRIHLLASFPSLKDQADTILQDFAEDKILQQGWLAKADQNRGRFRDFLKISLRNFVLNRLSTAEARNPAIPLDDLPQELPEPQTVAEEFDLAWARAVLAEALRRMEADCKDPAADQPRRSYIWEMFRLRLLDPIINGAPEMPYDQLIERFKLKSPMDASNTLLSAKRIFKTHLTAVIREYARQDSAAALEALALEEFLGRLANKN